MWSLPNEHLFINLPIEFYSPISGGAIATIIAQTGRELVLGGHEVTVLTPVNDDSLYNVGTIIPVEAKLRGDLTFLRRRWSNVRRRIGRYDWPYYEFFLRSVVEKLRRLKSVPDAVVMFNDLYLPAYVRRVIPGARIAVWLQNECRTHPANLGNTIAATDVFLTCSQYIADWTASTHSIPAERFCVTHSGVDTAAFFARADYLRPPRVPRVLVLGRLDRNKGTDLATTAVAALRAEGIDVTLTIAGGIWFYSTVDPAEDPFYRSLMKQIKQIAATALGHVPRASVPALVRSHDIVCVLSRSNEPFGLVVLEAMASGCAVIASNRGGLPEACGGAAMLVDPDDLPAVEATLRKLVTDQAFLVEQKRRSTDRAARAGWNQTAHRVERALERTAKLTNDVR